MLFSVYMVLRKTKIVLKILRDRYKNESNTWNYKCILQFKSSSFPAPILFFQLFHCLQHKEEKKKKSKGEQEGIREVIDSGQGAQLCDRGFPCMGEALGSSLGSPPFLQNSSGPTWPPVVMLFPTKGNILSWREARTSENSGNQWKKLTQVRRWI